MRARRHGPRSFDAVTVGQRETDAWTAYYRHEWAALLRASVAMVAAGFGMNGADTVRGWASTLVVILFLGGAQLLMIGVVGEYLSRIYDEVKQRPLYVVEELRGFDAGDDYVTTQARGAAAGSGSSTSTESSFER